MEISFREMHLDEDQVTVRIIGSAFGYSIPIKISVLQLAKIFGTDGEVGEECQNIGFGSLELEEKCKETREFVGKFPDIKVWDNEVKFEYTSVQDESWKNKPTNPDIIWICAEDIVGWSNEGILMDIPKELYNKKLKDKEFEVFVTPFSVRFEIKE